MEKVRFRKVSVNWVVMFGEIDCGPQGTEEVHVAPEWMRVG